jgi:hypothetical protein
MCAQQISQHSQGGPRDQAKAAPETKTSTPAAATRARSVLLVLVAFH